MNDSHACAPDPPTRTGSFHFPHRRTRLSPETMQLTSIHLKQGSLQQGQWSSGGKCPPRAHLVRIAMALISLVLIASATAAPQRPVRVRAQLSTGVAKLGANVQLVITAEGDPAATLESLPPVDGLRISQPASPMYSEFTHRVAGRQVRRITLSWTLQVETLREGKFELPSVRVVSNGRGHLGQVLPASLTVVRDIQGADMGFLEVSEVPERVYEGQPFSVHLRAGWDANLQVASAGMVLPWWGRLPGTLELNTGQENLGRKVVTIGLNRSGRVDVVGPFEENRDNGVFHVVELKRRFLPTRPGVLDFAQGIFEFGELVGNAGPFGRRKTRDFYAVLPQFDVQVLRVPEEGRPFAWTGAVGSLSVDRETDTRDVDQGASIHLTMRWQGDGNLEFFDLPDLSRLDAFRGFRILGVEDIPGVLERKATWELVPVDANLEAIPAIPLWVFNPMSKAYEMLESEPVPIRVRAVEGGLDPALGGPVLDAPDVLGIDPHARTGPDPEGPSGSNLLVGYFLLPLAWLAGRMFVRRRGDPGGLAARRRRAAPRHLSRALGRAENAADQRQALAIFLGACSGQSDQSWIGRAPGLLSSAGGQELEILLASLDAAIHGGDNAPLDKAMIERVARGAGI